MELQEVFDIRPMNEWMRASRSKPVPGQLFGEAWREGEIAVLFADTGRGKSVLAVQIAESIARGRPLYPFESTVKPQPVLYLDFELTEKQIEMRYTAEFDPAKGPRLKRPYAFSERLHRVELRPEMLGLSGKRPIEETIRDLIQPLILEKRARILIIDNITYLKRSADGSRDTIPLMKELQRLKRRFGLSILIIAHTPKRDARRPLGVNDLPGSRAIVNDADSIFAIGQSRRDASERFIKPVKTRSSDPVFNESHLPVFTLGKIGGNFLGFEFKQYAAEKEMLREPSLSDEWPVIKQVKFLHECGKSLREIADEMGFSKTSAHRYLQLWDAETAAEDERRIAEENGRRSEQEERQRLRQETVESDAWQPPKEAYPGEWTDNYMIRIGMRPVCRERLIANGEWPEHLALSGTGVSPEATEAEEPEHPPSTCEEPDAAELNPLDKMKRIEDDEGNVRFIDEEYDNGTPRISYSYRSDGALRRWDHTLGGSTGSPADPERFGKYVKIDPPQRVRSCNGFR